MSHHQCSVWGCSNRKGRCPEDVHGERRCSCEELRTKGWPETDTLLTLHNIGKMPQTVSRDIIKRLKLYATGFWWCTVEAWERGLCLQLPLWGASGAISGKTERAADFVQAATAITSLSAGREKGTSPSRMSRTTFHVLWHFSRRSGKRGMWH